MKTTMYFKTVEEMENYFPDGVPNNVLAVIEDGGDNVLFTSTNNTEQGEAVEQGGYVTDPVDKARIAALEEDKADKSDVYTKTEVDNKIQNVEVDLTGYATESYVTTTVQNVVGAAPAALDTLKEIGDALNNDADFAGTMTTALAGKANAADVYNKSEVDAKIAGIDVDYTETDPVFSASPAASITQANINSWSSKISTESDPIYSASPAANITSERMAVWDAKVSNVQGDWNESDSTSGAYINNKPYVFIGGHRYAVGIGNSDTSVQGLYSFGAGNWITTYNQGEVGVGEYNYSHRNFTETQFSVGIGTRFDRKNALEIMKNGDLYAYGVGNYNGSSYSTANTLAYVINDLQDQIDNAGTPDLSSYVSKTELSAQSYALNDNVFIDIYANDRINHWAAVEYLREAGILEYNIDNSQNPSSYWTIADLGGMSSTDLSNFNEGLGIK